ncbi:hypothetical protein [Kiritimatiella glycovorans]|uniref:hypothetical protein n=1 Tax=Kiritimatiella glycovorans TaxID=1307763 RepID=UPI001364CF92|nr:hypothetical protein [Kiritimatiella glycovorans]
MNPALCRQILQKDNPGMTGLAENLTVLVLVPGILTAGYVLLRRRSRLPSRGLRLWLLAWTLACVYFAGEEASWGQWYFGWGTPDPLAAVNDQSETNLHNMSSWMDQKPRAAVEVFIVVGGLLLPAALRKKRDLLRRLPRPDLVPWLVAPGLCWAAAGYLVLLHVAEVLPGAFFELHDQSELRELVIAWFLSLYLISYAFRTGETVSRT